MRKNNSLKVFILMLTILLVIGAMFWKPWQYSLTSKDYQLYDTVSTIDIPNTYIAENEVQTEVIIPEVYELLHVVIAISEYGKNEMIVQDTAYHEDVLEYFKAYKNHAIVKKVGESLMTSRSRYNAWKNPTAAYTLIDNRIIHNAVHPIPENNVFNKNVELFEDFAKKTNFQVFYQNHQQYYQKEINRYKTIVSVKQMKDFMENNFDRRFNSYKIIFSPLAGQTPHNTLAFSAKEANYKETYIFNSAPQYYFNTLDTIQAKGLLNSNTFTEIDHNYINVVTHNYKDQVVQAFRNLHEWNAQEGYSSIPETFNEYMTWGTFTLYAYDHFDEAMFKQTKDLIENIMVEGRGFIRFKAFNNQLLELYQSKEQRTTIQDLYPDIIDWAKTYQE